MDLITLALAKKYTNKKFESAVGFQGFKVVTELPTTNISTASIYLLKLPYAESGNLYEEYIYVDGAWESLETTISLEGYVTEEALSKALEEYHTNLADFETIAQDSCEVYSDNAAAFGAYSKAGQKGFNVVIPSDSKTVDANGDEQIIIPSDWKNGKYYILDSVEGLEIGDIFSIRLTEHRYNLGAIVDIDPTLNKITVDNFFNDTYVKNVPYFWILSKPTVGTVDFATSAFAAGFGSEANGFGATALGYRNKSHGWHSFTAGSGNEAHYGAVALGEDNKSLGTSSFSVGDSNEALQYGAGAIGVRNKVDAPAGFAAGVDNKVTGRGGVTLGVDNNVKAEGGFAAGTKNTVNGAFGAALGQENEVGGQSSFTAGKGNKTNRELSAALGEGLETNARAQVAVGQYNAVRSGSIFIVGTGYKNGETIQRRTSFEVLTNGEIRAHSRITLRDPSNGKDLVSIYTNDDGSEGRINVSGKIATDTFEARGTIKEGDKLLSEKYALKGEAGGASSWNDLKDKPFGEESPGPGELLLDFREINFSNSDNAYASTLFSGDFDPTKDNGEYYVTYNNQHILCDYQWIGTDDQGTQHGGLFTTKDGVVLIKADQIGDRFAGYYIIYGEPNTTCKVSVSKTGGVQYSTLNEEYIPHSIARTAEVAKSIEQSERNANNYTDRQIAAIPAPNITWAALPDKPFYKKDTTILNSQSVTFSSSGAATLNYIYTRDSGIHKFIFGTDIYICSVDVQYTGAYGDEILFTYCDKEGKTRATRQSNPWGDDRLTLYYKEGTYNVSIEHTDLKQIEETYIPDSIARVEDTVTKQYIDEQLSNISWETLPDKPFYEEIQEHLVVNPFTISTVWGSTQITTNIGYQIGPGFSMGKLYTIKYNSTAFHHCELQREGDGGDYQFIFNEGKSTIRISYAGSDAYQVDYASDPFYNDEQYRDYTISICQEEIIVQPLDNKFLSDTIARITDIEELEAKHDEDIVKANEAHTELDNKIENLSWDDLNNKPFGEPDIKVDEEIYSQSDVVLGTKYEGEFPLDHYSGDGDQYYVYFNDTPVLCTQSNSDGVVALIKDGFYYVKAGWWGDGNRGNMFSHPELTGVYNIRICKVIPGVTTLDIKYLPIDEIIAAVIAALPAAEEIEI